MADPYEKHPDEKLVDALEEAFKKDIENVVNFASTHGRIMFTVPLTPEEKWARFSNPQTRAMVIDKILKQEGPEAVKEYVNSMYTVAKGLAVNPLG